MAKVIRMTPTNPLKSQFRTLNSVLGSRERRGGQMEAVEEYNKARAHIAAP